MEKNSIANFLREINRLQNEGLISEKLKKILQAFFQSYADALKAHGIHDSQFTSLFSTFLNLLKQNLKNPFSFEPYHKCVRSPFDYYQFGLDFLRPLVDWNHSTFRKQESIAEITSLLNKGDNVIFFANHQTEADPHAISLILEKYYPQFPSDEMIFVAGERVTTDPLAVPFSMGRNLLCIYSKRYIDHPPEQKHQKQLHNKRTMELMSQLLSEGHKCIYVAPSGGRDRPNAQGIVEIAPFDPQSIEMFYLMAKKASHPTHFYPMALATYRLLPPPETIQRELGETRLTKRGGIHLGIGDKIDMEHCPGLDDPDKHMRRKARSDYIWNLVKNLYENFPGITS